MDNGEFLQDIRSAFEKSGESSKIYNSLPLKAIEEIEKSLELESTITDLTFESVSVDPFGIYGIIYIYKVTIETEDDDDE